MIDVENINCLDKKDNTEQLQEAINYAPKSVAITFGRMNPFTSQHAQAIRMLHKVQADKKYIFLSHVREPSVSGAGPLPYDLKVVYIKYFLKRYKLNDVEVKWSNESHIMGCLSELYWEGFTDLTVIVRPEIAKVFKDIIPRYNSTIDPRTGKIGYDFNRIRVVNSGPRVYESKDTSEKLREYALMGNYELFKENIPFEEEEIIKDLYNDLRLYM